MFAWNSSYRLHLRNTTWICSPNKEQKKKKTVVVRYFDMIYLKELLFLLALGFSLGLLLSSALYLKFCHAYVPWLYYYYYFYSTSLVSHKDTCVINIFVYLRQGLIVLQVASCCIFIKLIMHCVSHWPYAMNNFLLPIPPGTTSHLALCPSSSVREPHSACRRTRLRTMWKLLILDIFQLWNMW